MRTVCRNLLSKRDQVDDTGAAGRPIRRSVNSARRGDPQTPTPRNVGRRDSRNPVSPAPWLKVILEATRTGNFPGVPVFARARNAFRRGSACRHLSGRLEGSQLSSPGRLAQEGDRPARPLMAARRTTGQKIPDLRQWRQSEPRFPDFAGARHACRRGSACRHLHGRLEGSQVAAPTPRSRSGRRSPGCLTRPPREPWARPPDRRQSRQTEPRFRGYACDSHAFRRGFA